MALASQYGRLGWGHTMGASRLTLQCPAQDTCPQGDAAGISGDFSTQGYSTVQAELSSSVCGCDRVGGGGVDKDQ
jgi:hypothetical protein